jgi:hypothetical protein
LSAVELNAPENKTITKKNKICQSALINLSKVVIKLILISYLTAIADPGDRLVAGMTLSNPAEGMDVSL